MSLRHLRRQGDQPDLLSWEPPQPVQAFEPDRVRAVSLNGQIARAVAAALKECGMPREEVARRMGDFLGDKVSTNMLDAYASQARTEHPISLPRYLALTHATRDQRLLELFAQMFGWSVIDRKYLPMIELAAVRDKEDQLRKHANRLARQIRKGAR